MYRFSELVNMHVYLDSEAKFINLINSLAWCQDIQFEEEDGSTKVDLILLKQITPDICDELKDLYHDKLDSVYAEYQEKVEVHINALKDED